MTISRIKNLPLHNNIIYMIQIYDEKHLGGKMKKYSHNVIKINFND